jgi:diguanylate cyclase (GGDEF)-like protein/PAS domain S-box-containing protein
LERLQSLAHDLIEAGNEHFRIATQPTRVLFWLADTTGTCELVSGNWQDYTGQKTDDALGQGWLQVVWEEDRAKLLEALRRAISSQQGFHLHYRLLRADSQPRWVLHDAVARFLPSGKFNGLMGTVTDESDGHAGERALENASKRVYDFLDGIQLAAVAIDFDGNVVHCNQVMATLCGLEVADLLGIGWLEVVVSPASRQQVAGLIDGHVVPSVLPAEMEYQIETADGNRLFRWHLTLIRDFEGQPISIAMLGTDITQWRRLGEHSRLTAQMFDSSREAMVITDGSNRIVSVNDAFSALTGYSRQDAMGQNPSILQSGRHPPSFYQAMWACIAEQGYWRGDIWDRRKDGSCYPKYLAISAIRDEVGEIVNFSAIFYDVTERKALEDKLDHLAHFDALTGLPNRMLLQDRLEQAIASAERQRQKFALLFIDLDGFKLINDAKGHPVGDEVLKIVAQRLLAVIRGMDTAARLGGDEFVIILSDIRNAENAAWVADKVVDSLSQPYLLDGTALSLSASIGVSIYPNDELVANELLRTADEAMYKAKRGGKRQVKFYGSVS